MNKIKAIWNFFFGFKGRINRTHYLIFLIFYIPTLVAFVLVGRSVNNIGMEAIFSQSSFFKILYAISTIIFQLIIFILFIMFKYSYLSRRAHDFNKFALESILIKAIILSEIASFIFSFGNKYSDIRIVLQLIPVSISLICFISFAFIKGTQGDNKFGSPQIPFWKRKKDI